MTMQITVVGDEIRVDGVTVGLIQGGPHKESEILRSSLRSSPDLICEMGGPASFVDEGLREELEAAEDECRDLRGDVDRLEGELDEANGEIDKFVAAIENAIDELKNEDPAEALEILGKALDA